MLTGLGVFFLFFLASSFFSSPCADCLLLEVR